MLKIFGRFIKHNRHSYISIYRDSPFMLWGYIIRDFFFSFIITLIFFIIIFIVNQVLLLTKDILQIDIPVIEVIKLLFFALPNILSLSIPFATLVACLMSVGHFSTFNEFVAMRTVGVSFLGMFLPYLIFSFFLMIFSLVANEILLPWGTINFSQQYRRILELNPQLGLEQNSIKRYQDKIIVTKGVEDQHINGIVIIDNDSAGDKRVILADKAQLRSNVNKNGVISIELNNVNSISTEAKPREYNYLIGDYMLYNILLKDLTLDVQNITPDQQSMKDLYAYIQAEFRRLIQPKDISRAAIMSKMQGVVGQRYKQLAMDNIYNNEESEQAGVIKDDILLPYYTRFQEQNTDVFFNRNFRITEIIFYRKLAFPLAIMLFVIIAFPMGLFYRRSGRTVGFGVGLLLSFAYWFLIILNQSIGINSSTIPAFLIMWYPNMLMGILGLILLVYKRT